MSEVQSARDMSGQPSVAQLQAGQDVDAFLLVKSAETRTGKGGAYLDMNLSDRTGEINCKKWDNTPAPAAGSVIKVRAHVEEYNGRLQMRILRLRVPDENDRIDMGLLVPCAPESPEAMLAEIHDTVNAFADVDLRKLVNRMLERAGSKLDWFPAAQRMHHAERSGLLHHTTGMLRTAEHLLQVYPFLHGDLLRAGVIVHDLAKIDEMKADENGSVPDYTEDGLLLGHLVRGVVNLQQAADECGVSGEVVELLQHMIISHHGIPEYGSPRAPMFPEAEVLHWLDLLDARLNEMQAVMDRIPEGAFSEKLRSLDRRMYHPVYPEDGEEDSDLQR